MEQLVINGPNKLNGSIPVGTSKNAVLPIMCASLLVNGTTTIQNFPYYTDCLSMLEILSSFGVKCTILPNNMVQLDSSSSLLSKVSLSCAKSIRSSFYTFGAILARNKKAIICYPGGCSIGDRPIDMHLKAFKKLGADISEKDGYIFASLPKFNAGEVILDFPSVGVTENVMLLACTLKGTTIIKNCAKEPEIVDLQNFLVKAGAKISGAGTNCITIIGTNKLLNSVTYKPISDRIVAGTYMIAVACCGGYVKIDNVNYSHNKSLIFKLKKAGVYIKEYKNNVIVKSANKLKSISVIKTLPYPGFATDLQPQITVMQSVSLGESVIEENIFESRFGYIPQLIKMGANIKVVGNKAHVIGKTKLLGANVSAPDLRAGAGLVLAGLCATGKTTITGVNYIDRGYYKIEDQFQLLGANIVRVK